MRGEEYAIGSGSEGNDSEDNQEGDESAVPGQGQPQGGGGGGMGCEGCLDGHVYKLSLPDLTVVCRSATTSELIDPRMSDLI